MRTREEKALFMVEKTLHSLRRGGVYDQVGFGFHRYSTDQAWVLPHFEKMLYDQALASMAFIEAWQVTGKTLYQRTAAEIFAYIKRDMTSVDGGFYSGEDADSEGREGKYYLWTEEDLTLALGADAVLAGELFNISKKGNFLNETSGQRTGDNVLYLSQESDVPATLSHLTERLRLFRDKRIRPRLDDKILTDWNGLMIAALAMGGKVFNNKDFTNMAKQAAEFILKNLRTDGNHLLHSYRKGKASVPGFLDDYAFFIWGLLELHQSTYEDEYLDLAIRLNEILLIDFWDDGRAGFFQTPNNQKDIPLRRKEIFDGAHPAGNSVALMNLIRLGRITGRSEWEERAEAMLRFFAKNVRQAPASHTWFLAAADFALGASNQVIIAGKKGDMSTQMMADALRKVFLPHTVISLRENDPVYKMVENRATAYICRDFTCSAPITSPEDMITALTEFGRKKVK